MVRARFAPSPTGPLHVGSARTALLNWLFVRSPAAGGNGLLLLRIDDTDRERSSAQAEAAILADLRWLGLDWDEGPVRQSERAERHIAALGELLTTDRDGAREFGGRVIARADGTPLYNLAAAVDDLDDGVTHVLRGRDHLPNTELQSAIIRALGGEPPIYVHAPLLTFEGGKISKRAHDDHEGTTIDALREAGYPPAALCNALALSLADFGEHELMPALEEIAARFDIARLHSSDSHFDEDKLRWVSGQHIRAMSDELLSAALVDRSPGVGSPPLFPAVLAAARTGGATLGECAAVAHDLRNPPPPDDEARALAGTAEAAAALALLAELAPAPPAGIAESEELFAALKAALRERDVKLGPALRGLRAALTGRAEGPELPLVLATLSAARLAGLREDA